MESKAKSSFADKKNARQSHKGFIYKAKPKNTGAKPRYAFGLYFGDFNNRLMGHFIAWL